MKKNILVATLFFFSLLGTSYASISGYLGPGYVCYLKGGDMDQFSSNAEVKVFLYDLDLNDTHTRSWAKMIVEDHSWMPVRTVAKGHTKLFPRLGGLTATVYGFQLDIGAYEAIDIKGEFSAVGKFYLDNSGELYGTCNWKDYIYRDDL